MKRKNGLSLPYVVDLPPEATADLNERYDRDTAYLLAKEQATIKEWNKPSSLLRKVGNHLMLNFNKDLSYSGLAELFKTTERVIRGLVSQLKAWSQFPSQVVPIPKKAGWFQSIFKDPEVTYRYITKKERTIATMDKVLRNVEEKMAVKGRQKKKQKIKQQVKQKKVKVQELIVDEN